MNKRILLIGRQGQLARAFQASLLDSGLSFEVRGRDELNILDAVSVTKEIQSLQAEVVINCAAYTAVDRAESEPEAAEALNYYAVRDLGKICSDSKALLIHFSTDYVYHNSLNRPLIESDPTTPQSKYGKTKLAGEQALLSLENPPLILRISWLYAPWGDNFVGSMLRLARERKVLSVVDDQIGTPTYAPDLARDITQLLTEHSLDELLSAGGIYNYTQSGVASWYDFARAILHKRYPEVVLHPIPTSAFPRPAPRPTYSVLNTRKFQQQWSKSMRHWMDCLEESWGHR
jgi:dTDP-4-dehydrorhamnose reductase